MRMRLHVTRNEWTKEYNRLMLSSTLTYTQRVSAVNSTRSSHVHAFCYPLALHSIDEISNNLEKCVRVLFEFISCYQRGKI